MENEKGVEDFSVFEWSIENFSCWNREIHGSAIKSQKSCNFEGLNLELYPRGLSGDGEHLVVHLDGAGDWTLFGELSYIGPDGIILCRQHVDSNEKQGVLELPSGPKFDEVVAQIKKNEGLHKDRLTLRFLMRYDDEYDDNYTEYMHTVIDVFEVSFKMSHQTLDNLDSEKENILWINYPQDGKGRGRRLQLSASKDQNDSSKIIFEMKPDYFEKNILVLTRTSVLNNEDELVKTEEDEHMFLDDNNWIFSIALTNEEMKDLKESLTSLILFLKIIPSINSKHYLGLLQFLKSKVEILPSSTSISPEKSLKSVTSNQKEESATELSKELMCLYQDQDFSDFQLKCDNITFPVHRAILSARSPVFKNMLSCDMREAVSGAVDITDLDTPTLALFLTFLYTGAVEDLQGESALKLYYAADKYQVPTLKRQCADFLCDNASISNVCGILLLANKHEDDQLIAVAHSFILNNYNEVLSSKEWRSFMKREPLLALETLTHFAEKKYVRKSDAS